jgi:hypothetical protein
MAFQWLLLVICFVLTNFLWYITGGHICFLLYIKNCILLTFCIWIGIPYYLFYVLLTLNLRHQLDRFLIIIVQGTTYTCIFTNRIDALSCLIYNKLSSSYTYWLSRTGNFHLLMGCFLSWRILREGGRFVEWEFAILQDTNLVWSLLDLGTSTNMTNYRTKTSGNPFTTLAQAKLRLLSKCHVTLYFTR